MCAAADSLPPILSLLSSSQPLARASAVHSLIRLGARTCMHMFPLYDLVLAAIEGNDHKILMLSGVGKLFQGAVYGVYIRGGGLPSARVGAHTRKRHATGLFCASSTPDDSFALLAILAMLTRPSRARDEVLQSRTTVLVRRVHSSRCDDRTGQGAAATGDASRGE